mmetsp:Transcript_26643/g.32848  ORF Transcript_26643/g.32848 Transcript_26643/m.32848 type:complete len:292 (-) Transcript_26643:286-1161(-)
MSGCEKPDDDDLSIDSSENISIVESIESYRIKTLRNKAKLKRIRQRRIGYGSKDSKKLNDVAKSTTDDVVPVKSIMIVRTMSESLDETKISGMKRNRRRLKIAAQLIRVNGSLSDTISTDSSDNIIDRPNTATDSSINSSSPSSTSNISDLRVLFDQVTIREYRVVPGDNPSVSIGPPLQLDWASIQNYHASVDEYEKLRNGERRVSTQMRIPETYRQRLLELHGSSQTDIAKSTKDAEIVKRQRIQTYAKPEIFSNLEENVERFSRALTKPFRRGKKNGEKFQEKFQIVT